MSDEIVSKQIQWQGINIEVRFTANWLNTTFHHLELIADEPLSVTATGYRSRFIPNDVDPDLAGIVDLVAEWLVEAEQSPEWRDHVKHKRQGNLFDL